MKLIKTIATTVMLSASLLFFISCSNQEKDVVLSTVNGEKITLSKVDTELSPYINTLKKEYGEDFEEKLDTATKGYLDNQRANTLKQLIQEKVLIYKAKDLNLIPKEEDLNKKVEDRIKGLEEYYGGKEGLDSLKKEYSYTDDSFKEFIKNQIIQEIIVEDILKDITISDEEAKEHYVKNKENLYTNGPGANSRHILFEKEEDAKKAKKQIDSKKSSFEDIYAKYERTTSEVTMPISENLGFIEYESTSYDPDFLKGFKNLSENEVSNPVKSSFGYHLIKASGIKKNKTTLEFEEVKDSILEELLNTKQYEKFNKSLEEWKKEANVKVTASSIGYTED